MRRAFAAESGSAMTVMDKSAKSSCRVTYRTEKYRPRGDELIRLVSRGTWISEGQFLRATRSRGIPACFNGVSTF